ncbi:MAG: hypothetical protein RLW61_18070 [Gammaproteobacteria bacterium]
MTTIESLHRLVLSAALLFSTVVALPVPAAEDDSPPPEFSEAETRMWLTNQLAAIEAPMTLRYTFEKSGTLEPGFEDEIRLVVERINEDDSKAISLYFFTGERRFPVPPVDSTNVNLVLGKYLEGDVYEMNRLTDPNGTARERWRYFMRRIKFALSESATVEPRSFEFDGRQWNGYEVSFSPYVNDPHRDEFERLANKTYSVIVSDELPGYLYRIETRVPAEAEGENAAPLLREVLQLEAIETAG